MEVLVGTVTANGRCVSKAPRLSILSLYILSESMKCHQPKRAGHAELSKKHFGVLLSIRFMSHAFRCKFAIYENDIVPWPRSTTSQRIDHNMTKLRTISDFPKEIMYERMLAPTAYF